MQQQDEKRIETIPYEQRIFVNRSLRMEHIQAVGFDMDYTLAIYTRAAEFLTWELGLKRLVNSHPVYPKSLLKIKYRPDFTIRGLVLDIRLGNILKLDGYKFVQRAVHGMRVMSHDEIRHEYRNTLLQFNKRTKRFIVVDSLFERPEVYMYAAIIDVLEKQREKPLKQSEYRDLFWAIRSSIDQVHADGSLKTRFMASMDRYFQRDPGLAATLHNLRSAGKRLFLLTNSEWWYADKVMSYLLNKSRYDYDNWQQFFDLIIVGAKKPDFFTTKTPFTELDPYGRPLKIVEGKLEKGKAYQGGNIHDLEEKWNHKGDSVLYVGDNIFSDIVRSKKRSTWRTAMIIPEMETELALLQEVAQDTQRISKNERVVSELKLHLHALRLREKQGDRSVHAQVEALRKQIRALDKEIYKQEQEVLKRFNPLFGMLFKEHNEHSLFGAQMEDYACVYTSRVSNMSLYSPLEYFKAPSDMLPHELQLVK